MAGHKKAQWRRADIAKSSPHETRMLRVLYTTSVLCRATQTDRRWKREQAYDNPFRDPRD
jgi:hypothetical protein